MGKYLGKMQNVPKRLCKEERGLVMIGKNGVILNVFSACKTERALRKSFCGVKPLIFND